jgi:hypothetical protein
MAIETANIGIPERFEIHDSGPAFRIEWKWPRLMALPLALFSIAWDAFLVSWYSGALTQDNVPATMVLFPIPHVVVGLVLPYVAITFWLNSTFVEIEAGDLRIRHRPLPFPGRRTLRLVDVQQLFCVERTGRKGSVAYEVMARLTSGRETKLVGGLSTEREARFIEQRLEARLGLTESACSRRAAALTPTARSTRPGRSRKVGPSHSEEWPRDDEPTAGCSMTDANEGPHGFSLPRRRLTG